MNPYSYRAAAALFAAFATAYVTNATTNTWSGAPNPASAWSTAGNWSPAGPPGANDDARFFNPGATNDLVSTSSIVTNNTTIRSLWFGQTNGFHNILINPGVTLTIAGTNDNGWGPLGSDPVDTGPNPQRFQSTIYVGTKTTNSVTQTLTNTMSGGGTLVVSNLNNEINIREFFPLSGAHRAVLNLAGLNTFIATLGRIRVGDGEAQPLNRSDGQFFLAKTNIITLKGSNFEENVQLVVGNNDVNGQTLSLLRFGQTNALFIDQILIGGKKQNGNVQFNSIFTGPSLYLRGSAATNRTAFLRIGDQADQISTGSGNTGVLDLSAGSVDILADTVYVGRGQNGSLAGNSTGTLTLGNGTLDVNTMALGYQTANNAVSTVNGTANFSNTTVVVNSLLRLGRSAGAPAARNATLNISGGAFTLGGALATEGTATIRVTNSVMALQTHPSVLASILVLDGGTLSNAAAVTVTNSLTILNSGQILGGNPVFDMGNSGTAVWDVQGAPGAGLTVSSNFQGSGTYYGNLIQAPGATIIPGGNSAVGTLAVQTTSSSGNVTLNGGTLRFDLTNSAAAGNDQITASGTVTLNGTNDVIVTALGGSFDTVNPYTLMTAGLLVGDQSYFRMAGALAQSRYVFTFNTVSPANTVKLSVSGTGPSSLTWVGDGSGNVWNTQGATNWSDGSPSRFFSLDSVTFDDSGSATPAVNMVGTLIPGAMSVNNPTKNYTLGGAGGLAASGTLIKNGAGSLTFNNTAANSFNNLVTVSNGAVTFGNSGLNTFSGGLAVYGGSLTLAGSSTNNIAAGGGLPIASGASLIVANLNANTFNGAAVQLDGTLTFNQPANSTIDGSITGAGTLTKTGSGTLTLSGVNSGLSSVVQLNGGTIKAGSTTALGAGGVVITNNSTLDLNGRNLGALPVTVSGSGVSSNGAIVNTGAPIPAAAIAEGLTSVTLAGHTTFGGSGPWDSDPVKNVGLWGIQGSLNTGGNAYRLTKVGLNQVGLSDTTIDAALGDIDVQQGLLAFQGSTTSMGNSANTISIRAGATVSFYDTVTAWNKQFALFGNGTTPNLLNYNGANTIAGPLTLNGACVVSCVPIARGNPITLTLSGAIGGTGSLIKAGQDNLIINGTASHAGSTTVSNGTLTVNGSLTSVSGVTVAGGSLSGNGTITGNVTVQSGGTIAPGSSAGKLTVTGTVTLQGTTLMEVNRTGPTNDLLSVSTPLTFGGTLVVTNIGPTLVGGETFDLFDAPSLGGSFTTVQLPPLGFGLSWNTSQLGVSGTVNVIGTLSRPSIASIALSGTNVVLSGVHGTTNGTYYVLTSTDLTQPLSSWTFLATNTFDANGNFSFSSAVDPVDEQRFYLIQLP
jgi:autotransporter-associated beta strand protein